MSSSADVVSKNLIEIFGCVPDYDTYTDPEAIRCSEDAYRVALALLAKSWGDQLLEIIEQPPSPLTSREVHTLDALIGKVSAVINQFNDLDRTRTLGPHGRRHTALGECDATILKAVEETARRMQQISGPRNINLWLKDNAAPVYRRLRRLGEDIARRNQVLRARRHPWRDDSPSLGNRL
ncbi:hypothetical protein DRQ32_01690 [bacterium]|nr:MAG: hypothetical protein DRQ32_01690 [bacterium]